MSIRKTPNWPYYQSKRPYPYNLAIDLPLATFLMEQKVHLLTLNKVHRVKELYPEILKLVPFPIDIPTPSPFGLWNRITRLLNAAKGHGNGPIYHPSYSCIQTTQIRLVLSQIAKEVEQAENEANNSKYTEDEDDEDDEDEDGEDEDEEDEDEDADGEEEEAQKGKSQGDNAEEKDEKNRSTQNRCSEELVGNTAEGGEGGGKETEGEGLQERQLQVTDIANCNTLTHFQNGNINVNGNVKRYSLEDVVQQQQTELVIDEDDSDFDDVLEEHRLLRQRLIQKQIEKQQHQESRYNVMTYAQQFPYRRGGHYQHESDGARLYSREGRQVEVDPNKPEYSEQVEEEGAVNERRLIVFHHHLRTGTGSGSGSGTDSTTLNMRMRNKEQEKLYRNGHGHRYRDRGEGGRFLKQKVYYGDQSDGEERHEGRVYRVRSGNENSDDDVDDGYQNDNENERDDQARPVKRFRVNFECARDGGGQHQTGSNSNSNSMVNMNNGNSIHNINGLQWRPSSAVSHLENRVHDQRQQHYDHHHQDNHHHHDVQLYHRQYGINDSNSNTNTNTNISNGNDNDNDLNVDKTSREDRMQGMVTRIRQHRLIAGNSNSDRNSHGNDNGNDNDNSNKDSIGNSIGNSNGSTNGKGNRGDDNVNVDLDIMKKKAGNVELSPPVATAAEVTGTRTEAIRQNVINMGRCQDGQRDEGQRTGIQDGTLVRLGPGHAAARGSGSNTERHGHETHSEKQHGEERAQEQGHHRGNGQRHGRGQGHGRGHGHEGMFRGHHGTTAGYGFMEQHGMRPGTYTMMDVQMMEIKERMQSRKLRNLELMAMNQQVAQHAHLISGLVNQCSSTT